MVDDASAAPPSGLGHALRALALAVTGPVLVVGGASLGGRLGVAMYVAMPLAALAILSAFAFHVRFALGAFAAQRRVSTALATLALVVGVAGMIGAVAVVLGPTVDLGALRR